jgi:hypothetical protein
MVAKKSLTPECSFCAKADDSADLPNHLFCPEFEAFFKPLRVQTRILEKFKHQLRAISRLFAPN